MNEVEQTTLHLIFSAAMQEFLEKGFKSASLRNIVKMAGVTTGAFYGYYDSKEDLFEALVGKHYNFLLDCFRKAQKEFAEIPPAEQPDNLTSTSGECMYEMLLYAYEHLNEFKLILCCSEGTRFSKLIDEMVEIETKKTTNPKVLEDINELIKRKYDLKTTKQSKYQRGIELTKLAILTRKHL